MLVVLLSQNTLKNSENLPTYLTVESGNGINWDLLPFFYNREIFGI